MRLRSAAESAGGGLEGTDCLTDLPKVSGLKTLRTQPRNLCVTHCYCDILSIDFILSSRGSEAAEGTGIGAYLISKESSKEHELRKASSRKELPKYLPTQSLASKLGKLKAATTSLTVLQQNLSWVLFSW